MENMDFYKKLSEPPVTALKKIGAGRLAGMSDINPQWRYKAMTSVFGPVGIGWKYQIDKTWTENGADGEIFAFAQVSVFVKVDGEWSDAIVGVGGSKLVSKERNGLYSNDEGFKMAVTDAFSTSLKMIGVGGAIYEGRWDGSKYSTDVNAIKEEVPDTPELRAAIKKVRDFIDTGKVTGDGAERAEGYIRDKNLTKLYGVINYVESKENQSKEMAGADAAFSA